MCLQIDLNRFASASIRIHSDKLNSVCKIKTILFLPVTLNCAEFEEKRGGVQQGMLAHFWKLIMIAPNIAVVWMEFQVD